MRRKPRTHYAALIVAVLGALLVGPAYGQDNSPRTITVQGVGEAKGKPDTALVRAAAVTENETPSVAVAANNKAVAALMAALKRFDIADEDVQTSRLQLTPEYERRPISGGTPRIAGYRVVNEVRVRVRALDRLGELLDAMLASGANRLNGLQFAIDDDRALRDTARRQAIADAKRRAALYAQELGVKVGRALRVSEAEFRGPVPPQFRALQSTATIGVPVATGQQTISATVTVVFEME